MHQCVACFEIQGPLFVYCTTKRERCWLRLDSQLFLPGFWL